MNNLKVEHRATGVVISKDLATQILLRLQKGTIAVATDRPLALLSSVRKRWLRLIRLAERDRASTLDPRRTYELDQAIWRMRNISFTAQDPADDPIAYVSFATVERFRLFPPMCITLYIIEPTAKVDQYMLTSWMPRNGMVVIYDQR